MLVSLLAAPSVANELEGALDACDGVLRGRDPAVFAAVRVDADDGTIVWPNGADLQHSFELEVAGDLTFVPAMRIASTPEKYL